ncbi:MAG: peptidoglycan-binding protein LysM [Pseudomonadota bacterium]
MDLFGFAKDIGKRLFNKDEEAAEKIKELIETNNPGVKDLSVDFDDGIVSLGGECSSSAARQKCILMAGNVQGVVDVYATNMTVAASAPSPAAVTGAPPSTPSPAAVDDDEEKVEFYVIQSGDTLGKLAKQYYGNAMEYPRIFEANREVIEDPDKIFVGQKIRIPLD